MIKTKDMIDRLPGLIRLGVIGYLGFYLYGLLMGAYSPGELGGFTVVAVLLFVAVVVAEATRRRAPRGDAGLASAPTVRAERRIRETRGF